ncbi:MAG: hypothetical protein Q9168_004212 [Polycauliona sp. 1 TL-2023]
MPFEGLQTADTLEPSPPASRSTPGSAKSKYRRKFDPNLLASPSSKTSTIPQDTDRNSSSNSLTVAEDEIPTLAQPSLHPLSHTQSTPVEQVRFSTTPSADIVPKSAPSISRSQPTAYPYNIVPVGSMIRPTGNTTHPYGNEPYPSSSIPYCAIAKYHISPTPSSYTSNSYGGEACHRPPVGIDPSPPVPYNSAYNSAYKSHTVTPCEPIIPEAMVLVPAVSPEAAPRHSKRKHSIGRNPRRSFKLFFSGKK